MLVIGVIIGLVIGFELGVYGTRNYYQSQLDDLYESQERTQSEEDFLNYAKAEDLESTRKRVKKDAKR